MIETDWTDSIKKSFEHKIMVKQASRGRLITMSSFITTVGTGVFFYGVPLFGMPLRTINNKTDVYDDRYLYSQSYYPFNYDWSPMFEILLVTQMVAGMTIAFTYAMPALFFGVVVFHACAQCEILEKKTKTLLEIDYVTKSYVEDFKTKLGEVVETHLRLIRYKNKSNVFLIESVRDATK